MRTLLVHFDWNIEVNENLALPPEEMFVAYLRRVIIRTALAADTDQPDDIPDWEDLTIAGAPRCSASAVDLRPSTFEVWTREGSSRSTPS
ncbi:hypothetical protein TWF481_003246 [Arthrobotrys musiformis]|uniref:Uncharacterized protein n=1 Tax=Arthrobotrys musiformis TaxID=47236 RepID=A0AAV9VW06_9PEZI